eukprot:TRINITY_DN188_c0_g1_i6.p1 TRINITY_DN188_c0_g1~~TRINITY_DN188_c0_g1_i6.p1  ORF type:complete len:968 (+),score=330.56 TRINITY_DN188_c0_g1_i6:141-3044(+)
MCIRDRYQRRVRENKRCAMVSSLLPLFVLATLGVSLGGVQEVSLSSVELNTAAELPSYIPGKLSLVEIQVQSQTAAQGTQAMTQEMVQQARNDMIDLASGLKSPGMEKATMETTKLVKKVMDHHATLGEGTEDGSSGLDLIFRKLDELEKKIRGEQATDDANEAATQVACRQALLNNDGVITSSSTTRANNQLSISECSAKIEKDRTLWKQSRILEDQNQQALVELQLQRKEESEAVRARVDERNKAIDVLVKATFMVCQRFNRYKNTPQCMEIKSQPDVDEPQRYETKEYAKAQIQTAALHKTDEAWDTQWKKQMEADYELEGKENPEMDGGGITSHEANAAPIPAPAPAPALSEAVAFVELGEDAKLSQDEQSAVSELTKMANDRTLAEKYALPINELALSLKAGATKRSKSIVQILLEVLKETRQEQANDKAQHTANLNSYYKQSWDLKEILNREDRTQAALRQDMEELRLRILQLSGNNEGARNDQNTAFGAKTDEEDRCAINTEEYGIRTGIRDEDLENLVKLKSLLRALYWKAFPKACPRHNRVVCTAKANGWCVFTKRERKNNEQRCSCNVGYYGDACQFKMCPGIGKNEYKADAVGVCSNRGACNRLTGLCYCRHEYYHGPKQACDYAHAPPSKGTDLPVDDKCSMRGGLDPIRGRCVCKEEFFGAGCEERKCPNSNGVLYPRESGNACNGRGACDIETGKCGCGHPYSGKSCELEACPNDCLDRGNCDTNTGHCSCGNDDHGNPFVGPSCEFRTCPYDCTGGGECNRNDGTCLCKDGFSGVQCEKTTRCPNPNLNNANMNWWTVWDKPGWLVCPKGQLMYQLKRSLCQALSCIDSGGCAAPCEGTGDNAHVFQLRHCYHDLRWYNSFDMAGTSECMDDYFVAGLFRSCESLYCLNMAKCCSLKEARWTKCTWNNWAAFNGPGTGKVGKDQFLVGFKRSEGHQLKNIDEGKGCEFVRGY